MDRVSVAQVVQELRALGEFPKERRRSVLKNAQDKKEGFVLGFVLNYARGWCASKATKRYPELARLLCSFVRSRQKSFKFTSIMVNKGTSALHVDTLNCGPSLIISLGDHSGGELWQYHKPDQGKVLTIKNRLVMTDGLLPHMTLPHDGERFSLVFFSMKSKRRQISDEHHTMLKKLGFSSPLKTAQSCDAVPRKDLLPDAAQQLKALLVAKGHSPTAARRHIGDYTNKSIPRRIMLSTRRT